MIWISYCVVIALLIVFSNICEFLFGCFVLAQYLCIEASWGCFNGIFTSSLQTPMVGISCVLKVTWVSIVFASAFDLLLCNVARWILFPISKVSLCGYRFGWVYFRPCSMLWKVYCGSVLGRFRSRGHGVRDIKRFLFTVNLHNSPMGK